MEQIAPLARILAEANGIEWQRLQGSGEGGTVVEQDILNYLTRIMSGEEEPPSTPVDATPEGWTGDEQLPPGMFSADMLSQAGVDSDIAAFVEQSRPATPQAAADSDALEFELDDADGSDDLSAAPTPAGQPWAAQPEAARFVDEQPGNPTSPDLIAPDHAHAPLAAAMPEIAPVPEVAVPEVAVPEVTVPAVAAPEVVAPAPAAPARAPMGLGNLLSQLYRKDKAPEAAPVMAVPELQVAPPVTEPAAPQPVLAEASEAAPAPSVPEQAAPQKAEPETSAPEVAEPEVAAPEGTEPGVIDTYAAEHDQGAADTSAEAAPEPPTSEPDAPAEAQPLEAVPHPAAAPTLVSAPTPVAAPAGAVWFGTYLRRDAAAGAADDLRTQLSEALGQDVSLAFLVARAAGRHAGLLNLGSVALQGEDGQAQPVQDGALRDAVAALGGGHAGTPDLLVVDAGALGLDELHYPHTVTLSVGRVRDGAAALTLNGDVDARQAAQFLGRVAEALEKPIALVL